MNTNYWKKIKWYKRLLYIVPAFIIFVSSCLFLIPKQGISASADDFTSNDYQNYADVFAWDYLKFYNEYDPSYCYYIGNNDFFRVSNFASPEIADDGAYPNQIVWGRDLDVSSYHLRDYSYTFSYGTFEFLGSVSLRYDYTTSTKNLNITGTDFIILELYYDSIVIPYELISEYHPEFVCTAVFTNGSSTITAQPAYSYRITCDVFDETGFLVQKDTTIYRDTENGIDTIWLFNPLAFADYSSSKVLFLRNCMIQFRFGGSSFFSGYYAGFNYSSFLVYPQRSLTLNADDYLEDSGILRFRYGPDVDDVDITSWLGNAAAAFFNMQIFPSISLGGIIGVIIAVCVSIWILKFIAGG